VSVTVRRPGLAAEPHRVGLLATPAELLLYAGQQLAGPPGCAYLDTEAASPTAGSPREEGNREGEESYSLQSVLRRVKSRSRSMNRSSGRPNQTQIGQAAPTTRAGESIE
jgi:hypothetical protein